MKCNDHAKMNWNWKERFNKNGKWKTKLELKTLKFGIAVSAIVHHRPFQKLTQNTNGNLDQTQTKTCYLQTLNKIQEGSKN